ncbi:MAG: rRNA pseudouridine synthase [Desulfobulbaceae bacterium]|jgi:23S rRNA pseudouridine2605 synthase|nr:rRNA pseudouridine synthase [Desulfobulbaceae bacterium]MDH3782164.1 rRNA pseudouridine synthase [Desulfobulbaceae bacterium]MDH3866200.1 rRNA pseudouridine synthase [Desulfobulbaceae bacterium]MDH3922251.1 rRNA pseudouridine synthase [Desulfobulbaceae bacterium]HKJ15616.1 pseudouridine synthase [Desulfobulbales bacterium]
MQQRLQKILAKAGIASRRKAEELIKEGKVRVDGKVVTEMGTKVDPDAQDIECDGIHVAAREKKIYILLHKPAGFLSTVHDPQGRPIVTDLLPQVKERVYPVGRLDLDTEGALLLSNDGELAQKILHPSHEVNKTYVAKVKGKPNTKKLAALSRGITLEGRKTWPADIEVLQTEPQATTIKIIIHEGRKRQVRKMFDAVGHPVLQLKRTAYGQLELGDLRPGKYRFLSPEDIKMIFRK